MTASETPSQNEEVYHANSNFKKINSLLNAVQTRVSGLKLLDSYLPTCSDEEFIESCVSWMQNCCKVVGHIKNCDFVIELLDKLFKISSNYAELKKPVSFFITTRFFDFFFKYLLNSHSGWTCAETCFLLYRGACGPFLDAVRKNLENELKKNGKISSTVASCFALVPCLGGGGNEGLNYKSNWKTEFLNYIQLCHSIFNDLFIDIEELQDYDTGGKSYNKEGTQLTMKYKICQLYNYCKILSSMLLNQYPAPKCIPTDLLLQLICRSLAVNPKTTGKNQTTGIIKLQKVLPEIHEIVHSLLSALVVTCGNHLLPYSHVICKLIKQTLEWTDSEFLYGSNKPHSRLRIRAYENLCNWLVATKSGSLVENISKVVITSAVADLQAKKNTTFLKESKQNTKKNENRRRVDTTANSSLCYAALKALQYLIKYVGVLLKEDEHKFLQEVVISLIADIQNSLTAEVLIPYSVPKCRMELYSLLLELVEQPCPAQPPPTHFALRLFSRGQNDTSVEVSQFCGSAINSVISIIHSPYDNGGFVEADTSQSRDDVNWRDEAMDVDDRVNDSSQHNTEITDVTETNTDKTNYNNAPPIIEENESDEEEKISNPDSPSEASSSKESNVSCPKETEEKVSEKKEEEEQEDFEIIEPSPKKLKISDLNEAKRPYSPKTPQTSPRKTPQRSESNSPKQKESKTSPKNLEKESISSPAKSDAEKSPLKKSDTEKSPLKKSDAEKSPLKKSDEEKSPLKKSDEEKSPLKKSDEEKTPLKKSDEEKTPLKKSDEEKSPSKKSEEKKSSLKKTEDDSSSVRSLSSDSPNEDVSKDLRKTYFLRSKTPKASSEEPEVIVKTSGSSDPESVTPLKSSKRLSDKKNRLRTRASSRLGTIDDEDEKKENDDDKNIIESFNDSILD